MAMKPEPFLLSVLAFFLFEIIILIKLVTNDNF